MSTGQHGPMGQPELRGPSTPPPPESVGAHTTAQHMEHSTEELASLLANAARGDMERWIKAVQYADIIAARLRDLIERERVAIASWAEECERGLREANRVVKQADTIAQLTAENAELRAVQTCNDGRDDYDRIARELRRLQAMLYRVEALRDEWDNNTPGMRRAFGPEFAAELTAALRGDKTP